MATAMSEQLILNLPVRESRGREDFLVADCNRQALAWLDRWPEWPAPSLSLRGPKASGKSHLVALWQASSNARVLDAQDLAGLDMTELTEILNGPVALEDCDSALDESADRARLERSLLHAINLARELSGYLLLTSSAAPSRWRCELPDLRSRLAAMPGVAVDEPDETLLVALAVKLLADRQITVEDDVVSFLLTRIDRSFEAVKRAVAAIDRRALKDRRRVTIPLVRKVISETAPESLAQGQPADWDGEKEQGTEGAR